MAELIAYLIVILICLPVVAAMFIMGGAIIMLIVGALAAPFIKAADENK